MRVGILGLQGAVREHQRSLSLLGIDARIVKRTEGLQGLSGLIVPGGESTAISHLARELFSEKLRRMAEGGLPLFGTCAGMILLAKEVKGQKQPYLSVIDITVSRNATGRQVNSFETTLNVRGIGEAVPAVFIRAPYITRLGDSVCEMATYERWVVMARQGNVLVTSFHPELTDDLRVHHYFVKMVENYEKEVRG